MALISCHCSTCDCCTFSRRIGLEIVAILPEHRIFPPTSIYEKSCRENLSTEKSFFFLLLQAASIQHHHLDDSFFLSPCLFVSSEFWYWRKISFFCKKPSGLSLAAIYLSLTLMAFMLNVLLMMMMMCCWQFLQNLSCVCLHSKWRFFSCIYQIHGICFNPFMIDW